MYHLRPVPGISPCFLCPSLNLSRVSAPTLFLSSQVCDDPISPGGHTVDLSPVASHSPVNIQAQSIADEIIAAVENDACRRNQLNASPARKVGNLKPPRKEHPRGRGFYFSITLHFFLFSRGANLLSGRLKKRKSWKKRTSCFSADPPLKSNEPKKRRCERVR